jgi:hypothetical protein
MVGCDGDLYGEGVKEDLGCQGKFDGVKESLMVSSKV